eukprot:TRINITY_DN29212_c0_g1_i1.p1 TRINITY_DN29212_c0_g1~~TRINITY_DN29212_c0_g1_i1.p1  ORF type:complete len:694 (-),score=250.08 TRINITY_DN29212_c0_g1_i1:104-2185(-)
MSGRSTSTSLQTPSRRLKHSFEKNIDLVAPLDKRSEPIGSSLLPPRRGFVGASMLKDGDLRAHISFLEDTIRAQSEELSRWETLAAHSKGSLPPPPIGCRRDEIAPWVFQSHVMNPLHVAYERRSEAAQALLQELEHDGERLLGRVSDLQSENARLRNQLKEKLSTAISSLEMGDASTVMGWKDGEEQEELALLREENDLLIQQQESDRKEILTLRERMHEMSVELQELRRIRASTVPKKVYEEDIARLERTNAEFQVSAREAHEKVVSGFEAQVARMEDRVKTMDTERRMAEDRALRIGREREMLQQRVSDLSEQLLESSQQIEQTARRERESLRKEIDRSHLEIHQRVLDAERGMQESLARANVLEREIRRIREEKNAIEKHSQQLLQSIEHDRFPAAEEVQMLVGDYSVLCRERDELKYELERLRSSAERNRCERDIQEKSLQVKLQELDDENKRLKEDLEVIQLGRTRHSSSRKDSDRGDMERDVDGGDSGDDEGYRRLERELVSIVGKWEVERTEMRKEMARVIALSEEKIVALQEQLMEMRVSKSQTERSCAMQCAMMEEDILRERAQHEAELQQLKEDSRKLRSELDSLNNQIRVDADQMRRLVREHRKAQHERDVLGETTEKLRNVVETLEQQSTITEEHVEEMHRAQSILFSEKRQLREQLDRIEVEKRRLERAIKRYQTQELK